MKNQRELRRAPLGRSDSESFILDQTQCNDGLNAGTKSPRLAATRKQFGIQMEMNHRIILVNFQSLLQRKRTRAILSQVKVMVKVKMKNKMKRRH